MAVREADLPESPVHVAPMRRRHLRGVVRIEQQVHPRPWSFGLFMSELRYRETRRYVVAREAGRIVGYGGLMLTDDDGHVTTMAVDPDHQRRRVGTRILLVLARAGIEAGAGQLTLEVRASNDAAQALYRRFGFAPVGVRKNYYAEVDEDAVVMWAHDVDTPEYAARLDRIEAELPNATILDGLR